jgi:hypothetical protein
MIVRSVNGSFSAEIPQASAAKQFLRRRSFILELRYYTGKEVLIDMEDPLSVLCSFAEQVMCRLRADFRAIVKGDYRKFSLSLTVTEENTIRKLDVM